MLRRMWDLGLRRQAITVIMSDLREMREKRESHFGRLVRSWRGVYVDVGAYIGDTVDWAVRAKAVIAIEPDPKNLKYLNLTAATDRRVTVIPEACGDGSEIELLYTLDGVKNTFIATVAEGRDLVAAERRRTIRLDDLDIPEGDLLVKVDCEGAEHLVLAGAERLIMSRRPVLLIEYHANRQKVLDFLSRHGYAVTDERETKDRRWRHGRLIAVPLLQVGGLTPLPSPKPATIPAQMPASLLAE